MKINTFIRWLIPVLAAALLAGCEKDRQDVEKLVVISPHNEEIEKEFEEAFCQYHQARYGRAVKVEWRDVGGGASKILEYLRNVYGKAQTSKIDVVWGGGGENFAKMAADGILQPMTISDDVKANVPATFGGLEMYDPNGYWCGAALSGFGFLYNADRLKKLNVKPPERWEDLGSAAMFDLVALADPMQSGSAAETYEMIVQSGKDWPDGWAKLLNILGNAKRFYDGASGAADAVINEAPVAACIDFYGIIRASKYDELVYVSPKGQTAFSPDPIGILKNPPNAEVAQRFVDFVMSRRGQALLALPAGQPDGPVRHALMRLPIRKDVYTHYEGKLLRGIANPYRSGNELVLDVGVRNVRYGVLKRLIRAAAIDNAGALKNAKKKLIDRGFAPELMKEFAALPADVATKERIFQVAGKLADPRESERIMTDWQRFFRDRYNSLAR